MLSKMQKFDHSNVMPIRESDVTKLPKGCKTFEQWKARGFHVIKGEKAVGYRNNKAVFSPDQVEDDRDDDEDYGDEWVFGPND